MTGESAPDGVGAFDGGNERLEAAGQQRRGRPAGDLLRAAARVRGHRCAGRLLRGAERTSRPARSAADDDAFKAEYEAARKASYQVGIARIQALTGRGVETLEELLDAKKFPAVRLGAARTLVELGIHQHDTETIMKKLEQIESAQRARG